MNVTQDMLTINPHCEVTSEQVGQGKHKVITVDHFYQFPEKVLQLALELPYTDQFEIVGNFPGVRASVNLENCNTL